jgi:hypothetical protein
MNDIFNFRRFRLYFIKSILERPIQILGSFALSFSVVLLIYFMMKNVANFDAAQFISFTVGIAGGGCLLASLVFGYFSDASSGYSFFTLPVSAFEKWLSGVLIVGVIYVGCFLLFFRGLDSFFVHLYHAGLNKLDPRYQRDYDAVYLFRFDTQAGDSMIFFFNAAAAMLIGSLYFNKVSFVKTALVICGLYFFTFLLNRLLSSIFFGDATNSFPFHSVGLKNGDEGGFVILPYQWSNVYDLISTYILPVILLIVSFIRLREKEL